MSRFGNVKALATAGTAVKATPSVRPAKYPVMVVTPPSPAVDRSWDADRENTFRKLGVWLMLAYGFVRFSFLSDIASHMTESRPFLILGLGVSTMALMLISGGILRTFRGRPAYYMAGLMVWLILVVPFSFWKGGSVQVLLPAFETEFSMLFLVAGLLLTLKEVNRFLSMLAFAGTFLVLTSFYYGTEYYGRFGFSFGTLQNANDYATHLLLLIPFLVLVILNSSSVVLRCSAGISALLGAYFMLRTGSRGALLAVFAMLAFAFLKSTMAQRASIALTVIILGVVVLFAIPQTILQRYLLLVDSSIEQRVATDSDLGAAVGSSAERKTLLADSLTLTAQHPLFGVGPGMFAASDADRAREQGKRGLWLVTHNTYTEISSETGIPGFLLFEGTMVSSWLLLSSVHARARRDPRFFAIRNTAFCMMLSMLGFSICIFFAAMSYRYYLPSLAGLAIAFAAAATHEMNASSRARPVLPANLPWAARTTQ